MPQDPEHEAKFDQLLSRMLTMKPVSKAEISAKIKAAKAEKIVQKMDKATHPE